MTTPWRVAISLGCTAFVSFAWVNADWRRWDLENHVPTGSVEMARRNRIFERRVKVFPVEFDLKGEHYRISDAWLEHQAVPRRVTPFFTHQENLPELVLCVDLDSDLKANVWMRSGRGMGVNGVRFLDVGRTPPSSFILQTREGDARRIFTVE